MVSDSVHVETVVLNASIKRLIGVVPNGMSETVLVTQEGRIATITVNRPEKRNAMDIPTRQALRAAFEDAEADDSVRVVVLRGAGEGSFVAGGDIEWFSQFDHMDALEYMSKYSQGLYTEIAEFPKPTIAAVDGYALGGGTEIAVACDLRVATPAARFGVPEVNIGIFPSGGGTQRLASVVGFGIAKELVLTGRIIDADEARDIGLVNHVYPAERFDDEVDALAEELAAKAPVGVRLAKASMNRSLDLDAGLDFERVAGAFVFATDDQKEGAEAFLEDRDPEFTGK